jgi:hypothetical protein
MLRIFGTAGILVNTVRVLRSVFHRESERGYHTSGSVLTLPMLECIFSHWRQSIEPDHDLFRPMSDLAASGGRLAPIIPRSFALLSPSAPDGDWKADLVSIRPNWKSNCAHLQRLFCCTRSGSSEHHSKKFGPHAEPIPRTSCKPELRPRRGQPRGHGMQTSVIGTGDRSLSLLPRTTTRNAPQRERSTKPLVSIRLEEGHDDDARTASAPSLGNLLSFALTRDVLTLMLRR